jgi:predicted AAA+ superfamily ATPase
MKDEETRRREIDGLKEASKVTDCKNMLIITADESDEITTPEGLTITVVPAWRWLLQ